MYYLKYLDETFRSLWTTTKQQDLILETTGSFGRYQFCLCFFIFLSKFGIAVQQLGILFLAPKMVYTCGDDLTKLNTCPCDKPVFNTSVFSRTMQMEFNLICDRKWLASLSQTIFQTGTLIGSVLFGMSSDRFGRRKNFILACLLQASCGVLSTFANNYEVFTLFRFGGGVAVGGTMVIGFVIIMEFIGPEYREVISALYQVPFNLGHMLTPLAGFLFRDFMEFQMAVSAPQLIYVIYFFVIPETPRWLIAMKKTDEAIRVLEKTAKVNKRPTSNIKANVLAYQALAAKNQLTKGTILDLFRTPNLRRNVIAMAYNWFTCSYCFYGVSQFVGQLGGNVFANVASSASVTMLGTLASIPLMKCMGRNTIIILCHTICASCLFLLAFLPAGVISVVCASVGTVSSFIVFVVVYLFTGELFPTVVRNAAIGFTSMMARVGAMIAPFIVDLRDVKVWMSPVGFAVVPFFAIFITMLLPETKGWPLTTTIEEGERMGARYRTKPVPA